MSGTPRWETQIEMNMDWKANNNNNNAVFNPVAPYRYLLPNLYLYVADIANPCLRVVVGPGLVSTSPADYQPSSVSA